MAQGASKAPAMGALHAKLTTIFTAVLSRYEAQLNALDKIDPEALEAEMAEALLAVTVEPSPAMLSAISKFLKDNEITFDAEAVGELSAMEQRLKDKKAKRPSLASVTELPLTSNG